jgi:hypothetical protein
MKEAVLSKDRCGSEGDPSPPTNPYHAVFERWMAEPGRAVRDVSVAWRHAQLSVARVTVATCGTPWIAQGASQP